MKKLCFLAGAVGIILISCNGQRSIPTAFPTLTPVSGFTTTATSTVTSSPTKIQPTKKTPTPTFPPLPTRIPPTTPPPPPTFTPFPTYPTKKVVFEYYIIGQLSYVDSFYADYHCDHPKIVLYDDGQMLVGDKQIVLSANEIKKFLSKLDTMGFYSIESNQKHDEEDKLYNFGNRYEISADGLRDCVWVNADKSKKLCAYEPYREFLIPEMDRILQYLDKYKPTGLTPYYPDRILLYTEPVDPNREDLPATAPPWDSRFPPLHFPPPKIYPSDPPGAVRYIEGDMAKEIYLFITNSHNQYVFTQDGEKYIVFVYPVLPHETVVNDYQ